jgi:uncharacterized protein YcfL
MKKVIAIFAIAATLVACGSNNTVAVNADSTAVATDSTAVVVDSTVAPIDSTKAVK